MHFFLGIATIYDVPEIVTSSQQFWAAHARGELIGLCTSGTSTGTGRVIVRTTSSWVDSFDLLASQWNLGSGHRWWIPGPMTSTMNLYAAVMAEYLGSEWGQGPGGATIGQFTPATLHRFLDRNPGTLSHAIVAGAGLDAGLRDRAREAGLQVHHYYGAAELSLVAVGSASDDLVAFDEVEMEVRDGVLWVRSPWLSCGYMEPNEDASMMCDEMGFMTVGDRGRIEDGRLIIEGRPGAVTTAGQTVSLAPLENRLRAQAIGEVILVGAPNPLVGEVLTAVVSDGRDLPRLRSWARENLSGADRPRRWIHLSTFPLTASGKIDLKAIKMAVRKSHD